MSRPTESDPRIPDMVIAKLLPELQRYFGKDYDEKTAVADLQKALRNARWPKDGYTIARALEAGGWNPDSELVEILDMAPHYESGAHAELVQQWVAAEKMIPLRYALGTEVRIMARKPEFGGVRTVECRGIVAALHPPTARYTIRVPSLGHVEQGMGTHGLIINDEDILGLAEGSEQLLKREVLP